MNGRIRGADDDEGEDPRAKLKPYYAPMGHGFPRNYIDETPQEILFDPTHVLGCGTNDQVKSLHKTIVVQPRLETTAYRTTRTVDPTLPHGDLCPPPPSQLTYIKRQIHLDQSRDSETLFCSGCIDVPAAGAAPGVATVLSFTSLPNLRTFVRWMDFKVFDALDPSLITLSVQVDGVPKPFIKCTQESSTGGGGGGGSYPGPNNTWSTPGSIDLSCLPPYFHNVLMEFTDSRKVDFVATNLAPADRKVCVCVWGWIESITIWDEFVKR